MGQVSSKYIQQASARPFLKWAGGKKQLLPELLSRIPETFDRYLEPFIGGGALFFALQPEKAIISDINPDLINVYEVIKSDVDLLIQDLKKHKHEEDYFYKLRGVDRTKAYQDWSPVEKASRLIYLNKTCFNGLFRVNSKGQFNTPFGAYKNPAIVDVDNLKACSTLLQKTQIKVRSFELILEEVKAEDFIYFDPPYAPLSSTASFTAYSKLGFDIDMQIKLRDICKELHNRGIKFMVSNSSAPLILELYKDFHIDQVDAARAINSNSGQRGKIKEVIITSNSVSFG
jgi:DNA adenine methylase